MKYQCLNESCGKLFVYPMVLHEVILDRNLVATNDTRDSHVCPYCYSLDIEEYNPSIEQQEQKTVGVLVIDLVPGDNIALNKALADGYEIVGRYAKAYTLEKKQPIKTEAKTDATV